MTCRTCGTQIADKAIVCYRCGAATTDPVRAPAPVGRRGGGGPHIVTVVAPLILALVLIVLARSSAFPEPLTYAAWAAAIAGLLALVVRLARRR